MSGSRRLGRREAAVVKPQLNRKLPNGCLHGRTDETDETGVRLGGRPRARNGGLYSRARPLAGRTARVGSITAGFWLKDRALQAKADDFDGGPAAKWLPGRPKDTR